MRSDPQSPSSTGLTPPASAVKSKVEGPNQMASSSKAIVRPSSNWQQPIEKYTLFKGGVMDYGLVMWLQLNSSILWLEAILSYINQRLLKHQSLRKPINLTMLYLQISHAKDVLALHQFA